jgi:Arc/MetJ-type ribon-helix-helix transcriptional regulator
MQVTLTLEQQDFIRQAIAAGRVGHAQDALQQALDLWVERERRRSEVLAAVDEAEASFARGEGTAITPESMRELAEDIKRRGRARLAAQQLPSR